MHVWLLECGPSSEAFEYPPPPMEATGAKAGLFEGIWGEAGLGLCSKEEATCLDFR